MADQLSASALSAYGNKVSITPTIDCLATEGVVFESAYCNSPLCAPSRASFMTGQLISENEVYDNAAEFHADKPTFCHYLREHGYNTWLSGKMHFCGPDQLHGFNERLTTDIYPADFGWTPDWQEPNQRLDWYHNMSSVLEAGECVRTNQMDFDDEALFYARQRLYDEARHGNEHPFLLLMSLTHPHDPFTIPRRYLDRYREEAIDMPKVTAAQVSSDPHSDRLRAMYQLTDNLLSDDHVRRARHAYYGALSYVDDCFAQIITTLKETALYTNTIVIITSDHGEMLGERGLWYKMNFFEGASRIPLIVYGPALFPSRRINANVSLIDLLPTLIEIAAGDNYANFMPAAPLHGVSLVGHLNGKDGPDTAFSEYLAEGALGPMVMIRRGKWKYISSFNEPAQLFDLDKDPLELHNLSGDAAVIQYEMAFALEVNQRWDLAKLDQRVKASQCRRRFLSKIAGRSFIPKWDYQPFQDASQRFIRNNQTLDEQESFSRYPRK